MDLVDRRCDVALSGLMWACTSGEVLSEIEAQVGELWYCSHLPGPVDSYTTVAYFGHRKGRHQGIYFNFDGHDGSRGTQPYPRTCSADEYKDCPTSLDEQKVGWREHLRQTRMRRNRASDTSSDHEVLERRIEQ